MRMRSASVPRVCGELDRKVRLVVQGREGRWKNLPEERVSHRRTVKARIQRYLRSVRELKALCARSRGKI